MKFLHIVGNRPQFVKLSPFLKATAAYPEIKNVIIHTGQHYDNAMSSVFFRDLELPEPDYNLGAGPGTHGMQTGKMLMGLDPVLISEKPDVVIVYGDTNSTLAGALAASKLHIPLAHVESGVRERIWRPEETNRIVADNCADFCFTPMESAVDNLMNENIARSKIYHTGDITYDAFLQNKGKAFEAADYAIRNTDWILWTMHRAETVEVYSRLHSIVDAMLECTIEIVFPMHPRTEKALKLFGCFDALLTADHVHMVDPIGYLEFLHMLIHCSLVVTDSSGVLKEAFYAEKMCVTIDETTEYGYELFGTGYNILSGFNSQRIKTCINVMLKTKFSEQNKTTFQYRPFGQGHAAESMVKILMEKL